MNELKAKDYNEGMQDLTSQRKLIEDKICEAISGKRDSNQPRADIEEKIRFFAKEEIAKATYKSLNFWAQTLLLPIIIAIIVAILFHKW